MPPLLPLSLHLSLSPSLPLSFPPSLLPSLRLYFPPSLLPFLSPSLPLYFPPFFPPSLSLSLPPSFPPYLSLSPFLPPSPLPPLRFVNSYGYVNLFPMLLKILPPTSDKLAIMFTHLRDTSVSNWGKN